MSGRVDSHGQPTHGCVLRPLEAGDAGELLTLQRAAFVAEAQLYDDPHLPALTQTLAELEQEIRTSTGIVAVVASRIVGAIRMRCYVGTLYLNRVAVAPDCQGKGIGTAIILAAEESTDAARSSVSTGPRSAANLRLYRRLGYVVDEQSVRRAETDYVRLVKQLR